MEVLRMAAPQSVVKIKKNGVEYTSNVDRCEYFIFELCRAGLRDCGKFIRKRFRETYYQHFRRHTGKAGRATRCKIYSNKDTICPRMEIGLLNTGKNVHGFYGYYQEVGTKMTPKLGLLTKTVHENVQEIVEIQSQYLSALEDEARALALIDESEYEDDGEE